MARCRCRSTGSSYTYAYDDDGNVESITGPSSTQYMQFDSANQAVCLSKSSTSCDTRVAYDVSGKRIAEYTGSQEYKVYIGDSFLFERSGTGTMANIEVMLDGKRIALKRFEPNLRVATAGGWVLYIPSAPWFGGAAGCAGLLLILIGLRNGSLILVQRRPLRAATAFSLLIPSIAQAVGGGGLSDPPSYYWEISDPLGTGMVMMDSNGDRVRHQVFTPFGEIHDETGANFRTFYAGHRRDDDSGMFYMQARWYDPGSGRFLSVDPLIRSAGIPQSANPYSYTENNPVNGVDPTGEAYAKPCGGGCTNYYFSGSAYAASFGDTVIGTTENPDGSKSEVTGNDLAQVSEGGIATLVSSPGTKTLGSATSANAAADTSQSGLGGPNSGGVAKIRQAVKDLPSGSGYPGDPPAFSEVNELLGPVSPGGLPRPVVEALLPFVDGAGLFNAKIGGKDGFPFSGLFTPGTALAQTWGRSIYFRSGEWSPSSVSGLALIGHEATHVAQFVRGGIGFVARAAFQEVGAALAGRGPAYEAAAFRVQRAIRRGL